MLCWGCLSNFFPFLCTSFHLGGSKQEKLNIIFFSTSLRLFLYCHLMCGVFILGVINFYRLQLTSVK